MPSKKRPPSHHEQLPDPPATKEVPQCSVADWVNQARGRAEGLEFTVRTIINAVRGGPPESAEASLADCPAAEDEGDLALLPSARELCVQLAATQDLAAELAALLDRNV